MKVIGSLFFVYLISFSAFSAGDEFFRKDYSDHWIVYDDQTGIYSPLLEPNSNINTIHFFLDLSTAGGKKFEICTEGTISVFIDGAIVDHWENEGCRLYEADSLYQRYLKDSIQFSLYMKDWVQPSTSILYPALGFVPPKSLISQRESSTTNFVVVAILLMGFFLVFIRENSPKFFTEFSDVVKTFTIRVRASQLYSLKPYSREITLVLFFQSLVFSFCVITVGEKFPILNELLNTGILGFWGSVGYWLLFTGLILLIFLGQYIILSFVSIFFNNPKILHIQFYDNLRINQFCVAITFALLLLFYTLSTDLFAWLLSVLWVVVVIFYVGKSMILYLKMLNHSSHRKIHIFSYFCATEILPASIVVKVFFI